MSDSLSSAPTNLRRADPKGAPVPHTGVADLPHGRRCFLCTDEADEALVPPGVLVFRHEHRADRKWVNGSWDCPKEQTALTCSTCMGCLSRKPLPLPPAARGPLGAGD